ncbi:DUF6615 family protein [Parvibaculum sp.]|uniref:DUF6615 family protein n=1 Tax=Parvibaculum sp. TaxID=2024848 RepID=UPI00320DE054
MATGGARSPLCAFADWFPSQVAAELEQARTLKHQSRETSWTDRMLLELKKLRDPRIIVQNSNERVTGADMDWHFVDFGGRHLHLAVQAKILHYTATQTPYRYGDLAYPDWTGGQSRQLTNFARRQLRGGFSTFPLYLFYNPAVIAPWPWSCASGIMLASGYRIRDHLDRERRNSATNKVPSQAVEFTKIRPLMFCLHAIFCQPKDVVPNPDEIAQALINVDDSIGGTIGRRSRRQLSASDRVPDDIRRIARAMHDRTGDSSPIESDESGRIERPRVIFLSGKR